MNACDVADFLRTEMGATTWVTQADAAAMMARFGAKMNAHQPRKLVMLTDVASNLARQLQQA
jgi:hypothetical protein